MRKKISAILIDKDYKYRDYSQIKYNSNDANSEKHFELKILESDSNILHEIYKFRGVDAIITIGGEFIDFLEMTRLPFEFRKKWIHYNEFDAEKITNSILNVFTGNINRANAPKKFSIFTCAYNTGNVKFERLYNSLILQTYREWDWFILDDSMDDETSKLIESYQDPRITVIKNVSVHGNIGFNKHIIAMACDGDYLAEVDHDDELSKDCLELLKKAFDTYGSDFVYSCAVECKGSVETPIVYSNGWGWGEGLTKTELINGSMVTYSESPSINPYSIRTIYAQPNHIRCWEKNFYHKIGGHNTELSVLDDMDILIRTFLNGKMTKVDKALYFQYEGEGERGGQNNDNTQSSRFAEIQRTVWLLKNKYDEQIHNRILELGYNDDPWDDSLGSSVLWKEHEAGKEIMSDLLTV